MPWHTAQVCKYSTRPSSARSGPVPCKTISGVDVGAGVGVSVGTDISVGVGETVSETAETDWQAAVIAVRPATQVVDSVLAKT